MILNRPFRSVGELGYAYRDQPFKTLDLWSPTSGDAALLDIFSLSDAPEAINQNPYDAWLAVIEDVGETEELLDAAAYAAFCEEEG